MMGADLARAAAAGAGLAPDAFLEGALLLLFLDAVDMVAQLLRAHRSFKLLASH
jgi:hypothetical protein